MLGCQSVRLSPSFALKQLRACVSVSALSSLNNCSFHSIDPLRAPTSEPFHSIPFHFICVPPHPFPLHPPCRRSTGRCSPLLSLPFQPATSLFRLSAPHNLSQ